MPGPRGVLSSGANRAVNRPRRVPANGPPKSWFQLEAHAELNGRDLAPPPPRTRGSSEVKCALLWAQVFGAIAQLRLTGYFEFSRFLGSFGYPTIRRLARQGPHRAKRELG